MNPVLSFLRWLLAVWIASALLFAVLLVQPAKAQSQCAPVDQILSLLADKYSEQLIGEGFGPNGIRLLLFAHPDGNTWTTVVVVPDGTACLLASGTDWTLHDFTPAGQET